MNEDGDSEHGQKNDPANIADINWGTSILQLKTSTRVRKLVQSLTYDSCIAQHYLFVDKVSNCIEPKCFEDACEQSKWNMLLRKKLMPQTKMIPRVSA